MFRRGLLSRLCAALVLATFLPVASGGCFGSFQLTRNLYGFNQDIDEDKWIQWLAFLVMSIIPVYGAVMLIDVVFANSVEFWGGDNPIKPRPRRFADERTGQTVDMTLLDDGRIQTVVTARNGESETLFLEKRADSVSAYDSNGVLVARTGSAGLELFAAAR
jgi:hypothetical protein